MDQLIARPQLLKQVNLSLIRRSIRSRGTATRAEITEETRISTTTVRSLLYEMLQNGEIESIGYDESSGGRKAERYSLRPDLFFGVAFCMTENQLHALLVNICEEIVEISEFEVDDENFEQTIFTYLDRLTAEKEIKAVGLGLPGIVEGGSYWRNQPDNEELYRVDIGDRLVERYGIPVILENDINATAIGFGRCYAKQFPHEFPDHTDMAYLHFVNGCVSAGFIAGGRIIRGHNSFAGELGLIPVKGEMLLDSVMSIPMDDMQYTAWVVQILSWICGILNPQYIALAGSNLRKNCIASIADSLSSLLPKNMLAEILFSDDVWHDYHDGMAHLTAVKMFDEVQFIKE